MTPFSPEKMKKLNIKTLSLLFPTKETLVLIEDLILLSASLSISLLLQLGEAIYELSPSAIFLNLFLYALFGLSVFLARHIYQMFSIDSSWGEWTSISLSVTCITLLYLPVTFLLPKAYALPASTPLMTWFVAISLLECSRFLHRLFHQYLTQPKEEVPLPKPPQEIDMSLFLKRDPLPSREMELKNLIKGKRILITGAGGTLGKAFAKRLAQFSPAHMCFVDQSESLLYALGVEMLENNPKILCETLLGDITCRERIRHIISSFKPDIVLHAAALKHVPFVEENLSQAVLTNIIGTQNVAEACRDFKVGVMLFLSTYDAIHPTNTMGATKRLSELYCQSLEALERKKPNGTRFVCVEFGNVFAAEGSVVPLFKHQIKSGGPLTLTHRDITRHFILLEDAVNLSLQAILLASNQKNPPGKVFLLERGEPTKIYELAKWLIDAAGVDIKIKYTGLRSGENMMEDLSFDHTTPSPAPHILQGSLRPMDHGFLMRAFHELETIAKSNDKASLIRLLQALIPDYKNEASLKETPLEQVS